MEFVIQKNDLVKELQTVTGVVEKRTTNPILANVLLESSEDGLLIGASDDEITIRGQARSTVLRPGGVTLPAAKLHDIARSLPEAEVQFKQLEGSVVAIACERTRYKIAGRPREEFPKFPELDEAAGVSLPAASLREMIARVAFAITNEEFRYSLNGALFRLEAASLTLVATDGHRLAYVCRGMKLAPPGGQLEVIVPRKALAEIQKLVADLPSDASLTFGETANHLFFNVGRHRLTSVKLKKSFPRYEGVMPASCANVLVLPTEDLANAVRRVALLSSDRYGRAIRLDLAKGRLELSSYTEMGEAHETLAVDYDSDDITIGFNPRYLLDFLGAVGTSAVRVELNPANGDARGAPAAGDKPGQFRPEPGGDLEYRYIVMPMHL